MIRCDLATMPPDLFVAALRGAKRALKAEEMPNQSVLQIYPGYFNVHSQSGGGSYVVVNSAPDCSGKWSCSCPDFQYRQGPAELDCKHIIKTKRTVDTVVKARMNIDDWEATREDCAFNAETCQGCMLFQNCKGHAERVEAT